MQLYWHKGVHRYHTVMQYIHGPVAVYARACCSIYTGLLQYIHGPVKLYNMNDTIVGTGHKGVVVRDVPLEPFVEFRIPTYASY